MVEICRFFANVIIFFFDVLRIVFRERLDLQALVDHQAHM